MKELSYTFSFLFIIICSSVITLTWILNKYFTMPYYLVLLHSYDKYYILIGPLLHSAVCYFSYCQI